MVQKYIIKETQVLTNTFSKIKYNAKPKTYNGNVKISIFDVFSLLSITLLQKDIVIRNSKK